MISFAAFWVLDPFSLPPVVIFKKKWEVCAYVYMVVPCRTLWGA
ncbi:hypothetical protein 2016_scaffold57_00054 [Bacteriophage sp.]|nr:hypothetical protein 2016_scaffold57_00054 [Bacteriophage sp.]